MSDEANAQKVLLAIFVLQQFPLDQNVLRQVMLDSGDADSFGSALVERGLIDQQQLQAIRQVVTEHLSRYGGDACIHLSGQCGADQRPLAQPGRLVR